MSMMLPRARGVALLMKSEIDATICARARGETRHMRGALLSGVDTRLPAAADVLTMMSPPDYCTPRQLPPLLRVPRQQATR